MKQVAEQRVDDSAQRGPVRPRRVALDAAEPSDHDPIDFVAFAANADAQKLPYLLEAAAAYLSYVEGRKTFTRPQLIGKVRMVEGDGYNREDWLRHFGKLLRDGKIQKTGGGRFIVSETIGFPSAKPIAI